jgi:hypothetical protein
MKKITLEPINSAATFNIRSGDCNISFEAGSARTDKIIEWLFDNTSGRFTLLGTNTIYFEKDEDAVHFMMVWG